MLSYNELKKGVIFEINGEPYQVMDYEFLRMQQRKPVTKTKIKNLITGKVTERNFHQNETFSEAEINREPTKYLYNHREEYWFSDINNPKNRFSLRQENIGKSAKFLKPNTEVKSVNFKNRLISIELPIKIELKVKETQPNIKGSTASGGNKPATLETGAIINVPAFINSGDIIRINTETEEYVERVEKKS